MSGHDVPIEYIDGGAVPANHKLAPVSRADLTNSSARKIPPIVTEAVKETDRPRLLSWSTTYANLMESFVLYGASVHPNAIFPIELFRVDPSLSQSADISPPRGRGVSHSGKPQEVAPKLEHDVNRNTSGETEVVSVDADFFESDNITSVGVVRGSARRSWNLIAGLWTYWRRERQIKKAVAALAEFDDRTLRDIGIQNRFHIEYTVRHGRDY
ncbi:MAG TPA: DUF1127 domain-containing protein [Phyllobacterium sp.]|nr:DUF1127 domain-containing protein [Phyllobacterium sp.]